MKLRTLKIIGIQLVIICFSILSLISCNQKKELKAKRISNSQPRIELDLVALQAKNKLGKDTIITVINDPVYHKTKKYNAINATILIQNEMDLKKIDTKNTVIVFECLDGYKPEMPLKLFLKSKAYLAYKDVEAPKGLKWGKIYKNGNEMNADPFYLIYASVPPNNQDYKWPYNVVRIYLEPKSKNNEALQPKNNEKATVGFILFQKYCITCHAINGIGGEMGPELNYPKNVTEYWKEKELIQYIVNPASYRNKAKMPTIGISNKQSQEIVDYLKYMSKNKLKD